MSDATKRYGIGGRIGRPLPSCRPVRSAMMNISSVQFPRPVSLSGVRLAVKLMPHGPANAVLVWSTVITHGPLGAGSGGAATSLG